MSVKGIRATQAEATRQEIKRRARALFASEGYAATSTAQIVAATGLTKGALYHHFDDKLDLFRAVVEELESELADEVAAAANRQTDTWSRLEAACHAYLDVCLRPDVQRIVVLDAPAVLGWHEWCEIDKTYGTRMFEEFLEDAVDEGLLDTQQPELVATMLLGALNVAARVAGQDAEHGDLRAQVTQTIQRLLAGLHTNTTNAPQRPVSAPEQRQRPPKT
jgi:AcrR family transcriptional regulator